MTDEELRVLEMMFCGILEEFQDEVLGLHQKAEDFKQGILTEGIQSVGKDTV